MCKPHNPMWCFSPRCSRPHPGAGKYHNGKTSRQNLCRAVDEDDLGALEPSRYSNRETCNSAVQERPSVKSGHYSYPAEHGHPLSSNPTPLDHNSIQDRNFYSKSGHKFDPQRVFLISRVQSRGVSHIHNLSLPGKWPQQIGNASGYQGRE